eukprot:1730622-Rhodomonas_salina.1
MQSRWSNKEKQAVIQSETRVGVEHNKSSLAAAFQGCVFLCLMSGCSGLPVTAAALPDPATHFRVRTGMNVHRHPRGC